MIKGVAASSGIAIGKVFMFEEEEFIVEKRTLTDYEIKGEVMRFRKAIATVREELKKTSKSAFEKLGKKHSRLFDAYSMILDDPMLKNGVIKMVVKEKVNVEHALQFVINEISQSFMEIKDEYLRERSKDIIDIGKKILKNLTGTKINGLKDILSEVIVIAHNLSPSDTIAMRKDKVIGFAIDMGGKTSHTAILAHSLGIPAVVGLKNITRHIKPDDMVIIDGSQGIVVINPDEITIGNYEREKKKEQEVAKELGKLRDLSAVTTDGHTIELSANIEVPEEIPIVFEGGSAGIGLYRTEYLYMNRDDLPSEEEQYKQYSEVSKSILPNSVIIRTLDLGADRMSKTMEALAERNPFMGLRAVRYCLKHPEIFRSQLRAILRASVHGNMKVLFPMISGLDELKIVKQFMDDTQYQLSKEGIPFKEDIEIGVMIEVPSAALTADIMSKEVDFFSIGTNDLIQYSLAVDRVNENVADLYNPLHISVLRLIKMVIEKGHMAGKWVGMCGEMAADPAFTKILIGMGLDELSMSAISLPKIKNIIRSISFSSARELADEVMAAEDQGDILRMLRRDELSRENRKK